MPWVLIHWHFFSKTGIGFLITFKSFNTFNTFYIHNSSMVSRSYVLMREVLQESMWVPTGVNVSFLRTEREIPQESPWVDTGGREMGNYDRQWVLYPLTYAENSSRRAGWRITSKGEGEKTNILALPHLLSWPLPPLSRQRCFVCRLYVRLYRTQPRWSNERFHEQRGSRSLLTRSKIPIFRFRDQQWSESVLNICCTWASTGVIQPWDLNLIDLTFPDNMERCLNNPACSHPTLTTNICLSM